MTKRLIAAALGFIGGAVLSLIFFGLLVSIFDMSFQSVMPAALVVAFICGIVGFCFPGLGARLFTFVG
jgi:hypothetical protein